MIFSQNVTLSRYSSDALMVNPSLSISRYSCLSSATGSQVMSVPGGVGSPDLAKFVQKLTRVSPWLVSCLLRVKF